MRLLDVELKPKVKRMKVRTGPRRALVAVVDLEVAHAPQSPADEPVQLVRDTDTAVSIRHPRAALDHIPRLAHDAGIQRRRRLVRVHTGVTTERSSPKIVVGNFDDILLDEETDPRVLGVDDLTRCGREIPALRRRADPGGAGGAGALTGAGRHLQPRTADHGRRIGADHGSRAMGRRPALRRRTAGDPQIELPLAHNLSAWLKPDGRAAEQVILDIGGVARFACDGTNHTSRGAPGPPTASLRPAGDPGRHGGGDHGADRERRVVSSRSGSGVRVVEETPKRGP